MPDLKLSLLEPPQIELDGAPVHISRHKAVALLVYLALTGQTHRRDALAALLWPEHDQSGARAGLRRALPHRNAAGPGTWTRRRRRCWPSWKPRCRTRRVRMRTDSAKPHKNFRDNPKIDRT